MKKYPKFKVEDHPFYENYVPEGCKYLIIGTFPTRKENRLFDFFYASKTNLMWDILPKIFGGSFKFNTDEEAVLERKTFLSKHSIGMTDMLLKCYRRDNSSRDECLYPIIWNDIISLLNQHTDIHTLILTSRTPVWGALGLLKTLFLQKGIHLDDLKANSNNIYIGFFDYNKRRIKIKVPISPSMSAHNDRKTALAELKDMYRQCFE